MLKYNFITELISNDLPKMFHSLTDQANSECPVVLAEQSGNSIFTYQDYDFNEECKNFFRYFVRKKIEKNTIYAKMLDHQINIIKEFSDILYKKFYKIQQAEDFYNDLGMLFESTEGKNSFLQGIELNRKEYKKLYDAFSEFIVKNITVETLFYLVNLEYIMRIYNNEHIYFTNSAGEVETEFVLEYIIQFYDVCLEFYINELNRLARISQILKVIEECFIEYKKIAGEKRALLLFNSFIEKDQKGINVKFKENRDIKFFSCMHEYYLHYVLNQELLKEIYLNRGKITSFYRLSRAEEIIQEKFRNIKYDKILVKLDSNGCKSIRIEEAEKFLAIEFLREKSNSCGVNKNQLFLYDLNISRLDFLNLQNALLNSTKYESENLADFNFLQNKKFNYKNFEKSFRETFIDICIRFAKCMTKSKPVEVVKVLQTNKLRKNKNGQKISSSNQSNSLENQLKSYENKYYEQRLFLIAKSGGISLLTDQVSVNFTKLLQFADPYAQNAEGSNVLFIACQFSNHEFVKQYLCHLKKIGYNYNPNLENSIGLNPLQIIFVKLFFPEKPSTTNNNKERILTLKRLLKYSYESNNIQNINVNIPVDDLLNRPFHIAIKFAHTEIVSYLLQFGEASSVREALTFKNTAGETPLDLCQNKKSQIYEMIHTKLKYGEAAYQLKYGAQKKLNSTFTYFKNNLLK